MWPAFFPRPAQAWSLARRAAQAQAWRRFWTRQGVRWARWALGVAALFLVVAAHLYLANQAVVLWEDIRTMQYESWQLWWDIVTWQTDLARQRNAQAMQEAVSQLDLRWPEPARVLYVPVALPSHPPEAAVQVPGVWAPPPTPDPWLPPEYTISGSQWLAQGGWERLRQALGLPEADLRAGISR
ncbi:MAG: hypothetical protein GXO37_00955 [Chloroflexi bacterium]|nr:hypothetical protein [Chloroflexota bacterium]